ncbi:beta-N-acetylhexosaminidase [Aliikangiella maris]
MNRIGPLMLDIAGTQLTEEDRALIASPICGGLILFSRNVATVEQLESLTAEIKQINPTIIIAVDQEGGRVQRFKEGFTRLPELAVLGEIYATQPQKALELASALGEIMALEIQAVGCDISFAPVLDLGSLSSRVIGRRAFSTQPLAIVELAKAYIEGMRLAGMLATGKHFPGHGSVDADSHIEIPVDDRPFDEIAKSDLLPFKMLAAQLGAIMPAHVIYPQVDLMPAGFSNFWLQQLRNDCLFDGVVFSDDLTMKGAEVVGDYSNRAKRALSAGCDMVLVCNDRLATIQVMDTLQDQSFSAQSSQRLSRLLAQQSPSGLNNLKDTERWQSLSQQISEL